MIEVGGQPITFTMDKVRTIYLGAAPATQQAPSARSEVLDALLALQSVTNSGVNYRDYSARVLEVRIRTDKYLAASDGDAGKPAIRLAMRYYELASTAWGGKIVSDSGRHTEVGTALREDPLLADCPSVKVLIGQTDAEAAKNAAERDRQKMSPQNRAAVNNQMRNYNVYLTGARVGDNPGLLWSCAAGKLAEAEKH